MSDEYFYKDEKENEDKIKEKILNDVYSYFEEFYKKYEDDDEW